MYTGATDLHTIRLFGGNGFMKQQGGILDAISDDTIPSSHFTSCDEFFLGYSASADIYFTRIDKLHAGNGRQF